MDPEGRRPFVQTLPPDQPLPLVQPTPLPSHPLTRSRYKNLFSLVPNDVVMGGVRDFDEEGGDVHARNEVTGREAEVVLLVVREQRRGALVRAVGVETQISSMDGTRETGGGNG